MLRSILVYGADPILLMTRRLILEKAGFRVLQSMDYQDTIDILTKHSMDVFIVCQSLDTEQRQGVLATAREVRPAMKTLIMTVSDDEPVRTVATREQIFEALDGPETLLAVVDKMLNNSACVPSLPGIAID